jgi:hypothetical protein
MRTLKNIYYTLVLFGMAMLYKRDMRRMEKRRRDMTRKALEELNDE